MKQLQIFGERIMVKMVDESMSSNIIVPDSAKNIDRCLGEVVSVGDGKVKVNHQPKVMEMVVRPGDIVLFQMNSIQQANSLYMAEDKTELFILNQGDAIARINGEVRKVTLETLEMLGPWVLVSPFYDKPKHGLILPENLDPVHSQTPRFNLVQKGTHAKELDAEIGDELICEKVLVTRLDIDGKPYGFLPLERIYGVVKSKPEQ